MNDSVHLRLAFLASGVLAGLGAVAPASAQTNSAAAPADIVEVADPSFARLIAPDACLTTIRSEANGFFEGPTWIGGSKGFLIFSDIPGNRVLKLDSSGHVSVFLDKVQSEPAPNAIHDTLDTLRDLVGSNGTVESGKDKVVLAMFGGDTLQEVNWKSGSRRTLASGAGEPRFDKANDLAWGPNGDLYFSAEGGLFRLHRGKVSSFRKMAANGLAFSLDGAFLYATDGPAIIRKIALRADGTAGEDSLFLDTDADPRKGEFLDGLKLDAEGHLWAVAPGGLWIIDSNARVLGRVRAPTVTSPTGAHHRFTNLAFGGAEGKTLFLTAPGGVYSLPLLRSEVREPPPRPQ